MTHLPNNVNDQNPLPNITLHDGQSVTGQSVTEQLRQFIERIERLEEEKSGLVADIREIYNKAKSTGFNPVVMRQIIRQRRLAQPQVDEEENLLHLYKQALGMSQPQPEWHT